MSEHQTATACALSEELHRIARFRLHGIAPLPWRTDLHAEVGVIFDAAGNAWLTVDPWREAPDRDVHVVAAMVVDAINARYGQAENAGGEVAGAAAEPGFELQAKPLDADAVFEYLCADFFRLEAPLASACIRRARQFAEEIGAAVPSTQHLRTRLRCYCLANKHFTILTRQGRAALVAACRQHGEASLHEVSPAQASAMPAPPPGSAA